MKAFRQWLKRQIPLQCSSLEINMENSWREALKWVLKHKLSIEDVYDEDGSPILFVVPSKVVEGELEMGEKDENACDQGNSD